MIELRNISKTYQTGKRHLSVLKGVDLSIAKGEMVAVMGASGSGKSSLLNIIGLLDRFDSGSYALDGQAINNFTENHLAKIRNQQFGFVFQSFNLIAYKTAQENVALPLFYRGAGRKQRNQSAQTLLERLGLLEFRNHKPDELSGGQKQRVAIARALIGEPDVIIADEPTGALDRGSSDDVMELLNDVHRQGRTVLLVTHDADVAAHSQRVLSLQDGTLGMA